MLAGYDLAWALQQFSQQSERLVWKSDLHAALSQLPRFQVRFIGPEPDAGYWLFLAHGIAMTPENQYTPGNISRISCVLMEVAGDCKFTGRPLRF